MTDQLQLSIIIPTYNEEVNITGLINHLKNNAAGFVIEIIVSDGRSTDNTIKAAIDAGANVVISPIKGRAAQMNYGGLQANGQVLYFLHADSVPPENFIDKIFQQIKKGIASGCFRLKFDNSHWFLKANSWFTRFDINAFRYGDQSLFVTKDVFTKTGGYNEKLIIMEDQEIIHRLKRYGKFKVLEGEIKTSAKKYSDNGIFYTQGIYYLIYALYKLGISQVYLLKLYRRLIKQEKL